MRNLFFAIQDWFLPRSRMLLLCAVAGVVLVLGVSLLYSAGKSEIEDEWQDVLPKSPRTTSEVRGLLNNMVAYRSENVPAFLPKYLWDKPFCAATVVSAVNFLTGRELLANAAAWKFESANKDRVTRIYDRSHDFAIKDGKVVETYDRGFRLDRILEMRRRDWSANGTITSRHLYVVGYHYRNTAADLDIVEAGEGLNSHLMLILGRYDGSWWGYHLFHDPNDPDHNPFRIEDLGESMPDKFDVVYIWKIKDTELKGHGRGAPILPVQSSVDYTDVAWKLGWFGSNPVGAAFDLLVTHLFTGGNNFPHVVNMDRDVVVIKKPGARAVRGQTLGFYKGVAVRQHIDPSQQGLYGREYQCVELANRFLVRALGHKNLKSTGHADTYFYRARDKGMVPYYNDKPEPPRVDDLIIFDPPGPDNVPGHVAVVVKVTDTQVCLIQQNTPQWYECLPLEKRGNNWHVGDIRGLPCTGWSRVWSDVRRTAGGK